MIRYIMGKSAKEILKTLEAVSLIQKETAKQIQELKVSQQKTDEQMKKTDEQIQELKVSQQKTDEQIIKTDEQIQELKVSQQKTDEQMKKTDKKLESIGLRLGNMGVNNGDMAEEFFFRSLEDKKVLGGVVYDSIERRVRMTDTSDEYDILLINGSSVAIIEVKYKLHPGDIKKLATNKARSFRENYRKYDNHKLYLGFASMSTNPDMISKSRDEGIYLLTQKGKHLQVMGDSGKTF